MLPEALILRQNDPLANSRSRALGGDVTGNGISKLVFTILLAEAERDRIRERVHDVKRDQKERHRNAMKNKSLKTLLKKKMAV